ncbi:MAG: hypothetical protein JWO33_2548, partial [Caulobacteraceae bacterium]|nr:hypothetical protein [Caulobacteraceae bacterium]
MFKFDEAFREEFRRDWILLLIAFCCLLFGLSAGAFALPFLFPEVIKEFGWTREQATLLATAKYSMTAISAIVAGRLIDWLGVWRTLFLSMALAGVALLGFMWVHDLTWYYVTGAVLGVSTGGGLVAVKVLVSRSFHSSQGTAMGLALLGTALGAAIMPLVIAALIHAFGWRTGFGLLSLSVWALTMPPLLAGYLWRRNAIAKAPARAAATGAVADDYAQRLSEILRQRNFWLIAIVVIGAALIDSAYNQHQVLIFGDLHYSKQVIALAVSAIGAVGIACRVVVGNILDSSSNKGLAGL